MSNHDKRLSKSVGNGQETQGVIGDTFSGASIPEDQFVPVWSPGPWARPPQGENQFDVLDANGHSILDYGHEFSTIEDAELAALAPEMAEAILRSMGDIIQCGHVTMDTVDLLDALYVKLRAIGQTDA